MEAALRDSAKKFAGVVRRERVIRRFFEAREAFEGNSELYALRVEYTRLVHELRGKQSEGTLAEDDVAELRELEQKVNGHDVTKELSEAQVQAGEMLQRCNTVISERLGFDYASSAAAQRSCGC